MQHCIEDAVHSDAYKVMFKAVVKFQCALVARLLTFLYNGDLERARPFIDDKILSENRSSDPGTGGRPGAQFTSADAYIEMWQRCGGRWRRRLNRCGRYHEAIVGEVTVNLRWSNQTKPDFVKGRFEVKGLRKGKQPNFKESGTVRAGTRGRANSHFTRWPSSSSWKRY